MRAATQEPENCASQHFAQTDLAPRTCEGEGPQKLRHEMLSISALGTEQEENGEST